MEINIYILLTTVYKCGKIVIVKEVRHMRKAFTTSIEESISNDFKANCAKEGLQMNKVLELFMEAYNAGKFKVEMNSYFETSKEEK